MDCTEEKEGTEILVHDRKESSLTAIDVFMSMCYQSDVSRDITFRQENPCALALALAGTRNRKYSNRYLGRFFPD